MNNIAFSGFMGSGKTVVGKALSNKLVGRFEDTDRFISKITGPIGKFIQENGMDLFRQVESQSIQEIIERMKGRIPLILSLGGGAVTIPENVLFLKNSGFKIVNLHVPFEVLVQRLKDDIEGNKDRVPFDEEKFLELYNGRQEIYRNTADIVVNNIGTVTQTVNEILRHL